MCCIQSYKLFNLGGCKVRYVNVLEYEQPRSNCVAPAYQTLYRDIQHDHLAQHFVHFSCQKICAKSGAYLQPHRPLNAEGTKGQGSPLPLGKSNCSTRTYHRRSLIFILIQTYTYTTSQKAGTNMVFCAGRADFEVTPLCMQ